jgi:hypothetical protein
MVLAKWSSKLRRGPPDAVVTQWSIRWIRLILLDGSVEELVLCIRVVSVVSVVSLGESFQRCHDMEYITEYINQP